MVSICFYRFKDAYDLTDGLRRSVVRLDMDSLPTLLPRKGEAEINVDSWLCDFLIHGKLIYLRKDNLLVGAEAWTAVHDVVESLRLLRNVLYVSFFFIHHQRTVCLLSIIIVKMCFS